MYTDPQTITVNAAAQVMPRIASSGQKSTYQKNDQTFTLTVSHVASKSGGKDRVRSMARIDQKSVVPDPLTAVNDYETLSIYTVIDRPLAGFSVTQVDQLMTGFKTWMDTASVTKLYGQES